MLLGPHGPGELGNHGGLVIGVEGEVDDVVGIETSTHTRRVSVASCESLLILTHPLFPNTPRSFRSTRYWYQYQRSAFNYSHCCKLNPE